MKKKLLFFVILLTFCVALVCLLAFSSLADVEGCYIYSVSDGEATITDVDTSVSGDVVIPPTLDGYPVTHIGDFAFAFCEELTSVTIPDTVTSIGRGAFYGCVGLMNVHLSENSPLTSIGATAFAYCATLTSVDLGGCGQLARIDGWAFDNCASLTSVTIPAATTSIGGSAFLGCGSLTSIYYGASREKWNAISFTNPSYDPTRHGVELYCAYTYTFFAEDGVTVLKQEKAYEGAVITSPDAPAKAATEQYAYTFAGFEGFRTGMILTEDVAFTAKYNAALNKHTYTFYDADGVTVLKQATAEWNTTILAPAAPQKPATARYTYRPYFEGFTEGMTVTGDASFVLRYEAVVNRYTYVFYDEDGRTVLGTATEDYGAVISAPAAPVKAATAQHTYTFAGFDGFSEGMLLTEDVFFTAHYDATVNQYTYVFYDEDRETVLDTATVEYGTTIVAPSPPAKAPDAQYTYTFAEFEGFAEGMTVTGNVSFHARYSATVNEYTYTFYGEDGRTILKKLTVEYGTTIVAPALPAGSTTAQYTYLPCFEGFTEGMTVTGDASFVLRYEATVNKYTYTFFDEDGTTVLKKATADYGTVISAPADPTKTEDALYTYAFRGWNGYTSGLLLTENVTFAAVYTPTPKAPIFLQSRVTRTAWGLEFVSAVTGAQATGAGGRFTLVLDETVASFVGFEAAEGVTVEKNGNAFAVTVTRAIMTNETLLTFRLKTSSFLTSGEHAFLSLAESETATATFAPVVIYEMGDVDGSGEIDVLDALLVKQHLVGIITLDAVGLAYADTDPDGELNVLDAMYIEQFIVEMRDTLGKRVEVVFVSDAQETTYTVTAGDDFTAVPEAPEGFLWSAEAETYVAPVFTAIMNDKVYYSVKE